MRQWRLGTLQALNNRLEGEGEILRRPFLIFVCAMPSRKPSPSVCLFRPGSSRWVLSHLDPLFFCFWSSQGFGNCQDCGNLQKSSEEDALPAVWVCYLDFSNRGAQNSVWGVKSGLWVWDRIVQEKQFLHYSFAEFLFLPVQNLGRPYWLTLAPMYLWMLIFFSQPHKEERFLFPIYPLICLSGAVALSALQVNVSDF